MLFFIAAKKPMREDYSVPADGIRMLSAGTL
jgi:hypothetical protein